MSRGFADDPKPWQVLSRTYLFKRPPWLTLRQDHVRLPSGQEIPEYWVSEYPPWVNVVAVTQDQLLVLIRQYRPGIDAVHFELPAGVVDDADASMEAAARRELLEETGYGGGRWVQLTALSANPALQTNLTFCFVAEDVELQAEAAPEQTEDLRVHLISLHDAPRLLAEGNMVQALHVAPLAQYLLGRLHKQP